MLQVRPTFILGALVAALLVSTAMASRDKTTCNDCQNRLAACAKACEDSYTSDPIKAAICAQQDCPCEVGKNKFCRKSCNIGGQGSLCYYK